MAESIRVSYRPLNSENESSKQTPWTITTLAGGSSIVEGASEVPPLPGFSSGRGHPILPLELNEDVSQHSSKRGRGRPRGSKNKPQPPIIVREDNDTMLKWILIEIPFGNDITETLVNLAQHSNANITVLSGSGLVSDITLLHPMSHSHTFPIKGPMNMTSIFGTYINANCGRINPQFITNPTHSSFSICLSDGQGQVFGGIIGGKVMSVGRVLITATLFKKPEFHRAAFINGSIETTEVDDPRYASNVLINAEHTSIEPNNNNGNNNTNAFASTFGVVGSNSTSLNRQVPPPPPANANVMQWNHSACINF